MRTSFYVAALAAGMMVDLKASGLVRSHTGAVTTEATFQQCITSVLDESKTREKAGEGMFKSCDGIGKTVGALLKGLKDAGYVASSRWEPTADGAVELVVELSEPRLFGEIATASKVPVLWNLDQTLRFTASATRVAIDGVHVDSPREGLRLYEKVRAWAAGKDKYTFCDGKTFMDNYDPATADIPTCVQSEMNACGDYLYKEFDTGAGNWKGEQSDGKITRILQNSYSKWATRKAVGSDWPKIIFQLISAAPMSITAIESIGGDKLSAVSEPHAGYLEPSANSPGLWRGSEYYLTEKSLILGTKGLRDAAGTMKMAEKAAKSGISFAKMLAYGRPDTREAMEELGITASSVSGAMNVFSWCPEARVAATSDPKCKSTTWTTVIGRVSWAPAAGPTMI